MKHNNEYELMQLRCIMKQLHINKNEMCIQCHNAPTFRKSKRCFNCVFKEMSILMCGFSNALDLIYHLNEYTIGKGKTFAKVVYSSLCWTLNVANFTKYIDYYGDPKDWVPEIVEFIDPHKVDSLLRKNDKPVLLYHKQNGVKEPVYENNDYYIMDERDFLFEHLEWIHA